MKGMSGKTVFPHLQDMMGKQLRVKEKQIGEGVEGAARHGKSVYCTHSSVLQDLRENNPKSEVYLVRSSQKLAVCVTNC